MLIHDSLTREQLKSIPQSTTQEQYHVARHQSTRCNAHLRVSQPAHRRRNSPPYRGLFDALSTTIAHRIDELDHEWDIERALECNASALAFTGVVLGATSDRRWLILPGLVTAFLFQHATQGWCPPLPILRRMGFRTSAEIDEERYALKALRGDFERIISKDGMHADPEKAFASANQ